MRMLLGMTAWVGMAAAGCVATRPVGAQGLISARCEVKQEWEPALVLNRDHRVKFQCAGATPIDVIRAIGRQTRLPIGIVLGRDAGRLSRGVRRYDMEDLDVESALRRAVAGTGFRVVRDGDGVRVTAGDTTVYQRRLLAHRYADFRTTPGDTMAGLGASLTMWLRSVVNPARGSAFDLLSSTEESRFTLETMHDVTTLDIANRIASLGAGGMWTYHVKASVPDDGSEDEVTIESYKGSPEFAATREVKARPLSSRRR